MEHEKFFGWYTEQNEKKNAELNEDELIEKLATAQR